MVTCWCHLGLYSKRGTGLTPVWSALQQFVTYTTHIRICSESNPALTLEPAVVIKDKRVHISCNLSVVTWPPKRPCVGPGNDK